MSTLRIDVYTDIVCPWCLIGQHRLDAVLETHFADAEVEIAHHPVMLMPDCPPQGISLAELFRARGMDPAAIRARPEAEARNAGFALDLSRQTHFYPTLAGHTLIRLAHRHGVQHAVSRALAEAYFHDARDIADVDTLADIGVAHGMDRAALAAALRSPEELDATRREAALSAARGVRSVPHYVFNDSVAIAGGQQEAAFVDAIRRSL